MPPAHGAQTFWPCIGAEVPGRQAAQLVDPTVFVAVPIAQGVHSGLCAVGEKVPTPQVEHVVEPEGEALPGGHAAHAAIEVAPAEGFSVPDGQGRHAVAEVAPIVEL